MTRETDRLYLPGTPAVEVRLRRSPKARRLSLRVSRLDGLVTLSLPPSLALGEAQAFLEEKGAWVRGHLASHPAPIAVGIGTDLPVLGGAVRLAPGACRGPRREGAQLLLAPERPAGAQAAAWLKTVARARLAAACDLHAAALGRPYARLTLRDTRSRWGSCSSEGNLMFSWRLAMAPAEVLDYVAAHEVAHLQEMNHSRAFWAVVARLCPDWRRHRDWLRREGAGLHRYRFSA